MLAGVEKRRAPARCQPSRASQPLARETGNSLDVRGGERPRGACGKVGDAGKSSGDAPRSSRKPAKYGADEYGSICASPATRCLRKLFRTYASAVRTLRGVVS